MHPRRHCRGTRCDRPPSAGTYSLDPPSSERRRPIQPHARVVRRARCHRMRASSRCCYRSAGLHRAHCAAPLAARTPPLDRDRARAPHPPPPLARPLSTGDRSGRVAPLPRGTIHHGSQAVGSAERRVLNGNRSKVASSARTGPSLARRRSAYSQRLAPNTCRRPSHSWRAP